MNDQNSAFKHILESLGWAITFLVTVPLVFVVISSIELPSTALANLPSRFESSFCDVAHICRPQDFALKGVFEDRPVNSSSKLDHLVQESFIRNTKKRWYVFGLLYPGYYEKLSAVLHEYDIELVAGGCVTGTEDYYRAMASNDALWNLLPDGAKNAISRRNELAPKNTL